MFKNNKTAQAVRTALFAGLATSALAVPTAFAAEEEKAEEVERIAVTGSRIQRTDMEGVSPITVISRDDLEVSGEVSVADVLRDSTFNSFGSTAESSGVGGGQGGIATVSLRGLGANRSVVLINGKRIAPAPAGGGGSADLNAIPFAAVERIEILTGGASAIYGADAIGGVVNVILRKDFEGVSVTASAGRPSREGADENAASIVFGLSGEKGNFVMSAEYSDRGIIFDRDRDYLLSKVGEKWADNTSISTYGRNIRHLIDTDGDGKFNRIEWTALKDQCDTSNNFAGVQVREGSQPGTMCGYNYSTAKATTAGLKNASIYTRGVYEINDDLSFNINTLATRRTVKGIYAPAAGDFNITGTKLASDSVTLAAGEKVVASKAYWRFTDNGLRDTTLESNNFDVNMYLDGTTDWGNWTIGYHNNVATTIELGTGYINKVFAEQFAAAGTLTDPQSIKLMSHTISTYNKNKYTAFSAGLGIDSLFALPAGDVGAYFYAERTDTSYVKQSDSLSDASSVIGSAGGSAKGDRQVTSLAAEFAIPVLDSLEATLAVRYDNYSDFGNNVSPQLGLAYNINDDWSLRSTIGKGFRAPTYENLYVQSEGHPWVNVSGVGWAQYETKTLGNRNLKAEKSNQFSFGVVGNITENISMTLDYNRTVITDLISYESAAAIWDKHINNIKLKDNTSVNIVGSIPDSFQATYVNEGRLEAQYLDLDLQANQETSFGEFTQRLAVSYIIEHATQETTQTADKKDQVVMLDFAGFRDSPKYRANMIFGYNYEDHNFSVTVKYIPSRINSYELNGAGTKYVRKANDVSKTGQYSDIKSYTDIDLSYSWQAQDNLRLSLGVRNLTDEDPRFRDVARSQYSSSLHSIQGRVVHAGIKYDF